MDSNPSRTLMENRYSRGLELGFVFVIRMISTVQSRQRSTVSEIAILVLMLACLLVCVSTTVPSLLESLFYLHDTFKLVGFTERFNFEVRQSLASAIHHFCSSPPSSFHRPGPQLSLSLRVSRSTDHRNTSKSFPRKPHPS